MVGGAGLRTVLAGAPVAGLSFKDAGFKARVKDVGRMKDDGRGNDDGKARDDEQAKDDQQAGDLRVDDEGELNE